MAGTRKATSPKKWAESQALALSGLEGGRGADQEHPAHPDKRVATVWQQLPHPCPQLPESGTFALGQQCVHPSGYQGSVLTSLEHGGEGRPPQP